LGLLALISVANTNVNFKEALLHWLTGVLIVCLAAKIAVSIAAFIWGLRRNAITARAIGWIAGGWLVCGVFVAGYAGHVCNAINQPGLRIWVTLGGFLILPMALAWNRHR
jgi:FtsH-binding integral membrane protein